MKRLTICTLIILLAFFSTSMRAEIVLVANSASSIDTLSYTEVSRVYTGLHIVMPNGARIEPYDHPVNSKLRKQFYTQLLNKSVAQMNSYWARLLFSGRAKPPKRLFDSSEIGDILKNNPNAIVYIDGVSAKELINVKIVYSLTEERD